ncbi:MAG: hypothetical protein M1834_009133 [Cirrosporium novae-zelandiae]|nr:MAG: hypothetical protein M1834_009133 [Cirrosporium novae-zelandiae]
MAPKTPTTLRRSPRLTNRTPDQKVEPSSSIRPSDVKTQRAEVKRMIMRHESENFVRRKKVKRMEEEMKDEEEGKREEPDISDDTSNNEMEEDEKEQKYFRNFILPVRLEGSNQKPRVKPEGIDEKYCARPPTTPQSQLITATKSHSEIGESSSRSNDHYTRDREQDRIPSSPSYRTEVLKPNNIFIHYNLAEMPESIKKLTDHLKNLRGPEYVMSNEAADRIVAVACKIADEQAQNIKNALISRLFPDEFEPDYDDVPLKRNDGLCFTTTAIPQGPPGSSALETPAPDLLYGYSIHAFSAQEEQNQKRFEEERFGKFAMTSRNLYFGFFGINFTSQVEGGSIWATANQCAVAGATCSNAVWQFVQTTAASPSRDQLCGRYSMAIDGSTATLFVNYTDDSGRHHCYELKNFFLRHREDIKSLKLYISNIIYFYMYYILPKLKRHLAELY